MAKELEEKAKRWLKPVWVSAILTLVFFAITLTLEGYIIFDPEAKKIFLESKTWVAAAKEFFFAFFISTVIIFTIERVSRQEQAEQIEEATKAFSVSLEAGLERLRATTSERLDEKLAEVRLLADQIAMNVFNALYKAQLDPAVSYEVEESVFRTEFVRARHERYMRLESIPSQPGKLVLKSKQTFIVRNVTRDERPYVPLVYLPSLSGAAAHFSVVNRVLATSIYGGQKGNAQYEIKIGNTPVEQDRHRKLQGSEYMYTFPAVQVPALGELEILMELSLLKDLSDNEIWTSLLPTLAGEVAVVSEVPGLVIEAISLHRGSMVAVEQGPDNYRRWRYEKPILPYQGYVVSWRPTSSSPTPPVI